MERYKNLGGNSNICYYETGIDYIVVSFKSGAIYEYTYKSAGKENVENMKILAMQGSGLNSYIMKNCKYLYKKS